MTRCSSSALLPGNQFPESPAVHHQGRDAVANRDAGRFIFQYPFFAAQVEDEVPVEGALPQQAHDGVFQYSGCHRGLAQVLGDGLNRVENDRVIFVLGDRQGYFRDFEQRFDETEAQVTRQQGDVGDQVGFLFRFQCG